MRVASVAVPCVTLLLPTVLSGSPTMNATPRRLRPAVVVIACSFAVIPVGIAAAQEPPVRQQQVNVVGEPAQVPASAKPVPAAPPTAPLRVQRVHPQVSQASLVLEYRPLSSGAASPAAQEREERIREALDGQIQLAKWVFDEAPLRNVTIQLGQVLEVPFEIDHRAIEEAGLDLETPVTFRSQGGTVRSALRRMLGPLDLTCIVRDECLLLTTVEKAVDQPSVRLYPIPFGWSADSGEEDAGSLVELVQNTVSPEIWETVGGPSSIRSQGDRRVLIVRTSEEVHEEVESLLRSLHAKGLADLGVVVGNSRPGSPIVRIHAVADPRVRADLAAKLVPLCNESLEHGTDTDAKVTAVGDCLAVQSDSPEFHILAGEVIRGVAGVTRRVEEPAVLGLGGAVGGSF